MLRASSNIVKVATRSASSAAAPATANSRLRVTTVDSKTNGARLSLAVNTGARDDGHALGLTHCLQTAAVLNGNYNTGFLTTQLMANYGASLDVIVDREYIQYEVACHPSTARHVISSLLIPNVLGSNYPHWELGAVHNKMRYQKAVLEQNPVFRLMEAAHKAAFVGSMANPLVSTECMLGKHSSEMLNARFNESFSLSNMIMVGSGISQNELEEYAGEGIARITNLNAAEGVTRETPVFAGREVHVETGGSVGHVALVFEGVSLNDQDSVALGILQHALGCSSNVSRGSGMNQGAMNRTVGAQLRDTPFGTSAANVGYSDCGLFVVHVSAETEKVAAVAQKVNAALKSIADSGLSAADVEAGRQRYLSSLEMSYEQTGNLVRDTAAHALATNQKYTVAEQSGLITSVSADVVNNAAKRVLQGKRGLASVGRTSLMPSLQSI